MVTEGILKREIKQAWRTTTVTYKSGLNIKLKKKGGLKAGRNHIAELIGKMEHVSLCCEKICFDFQESTNRKL